MSITLFVGDCKEYLADVAKQYDPLAYLVDFSNYKDYLNSTEVTITAYTSFSDLPKISKTQAVFYDVLNKADRIFYSPPEVWSDATTEFSVQNQKQITEYFLYMINQMKNNVQGLDVNSYSHPAYLKLQDQRTTDGCQLWVAGCSITEGVGVEFNEKYSFKIAGNFNNIFSDLSKGGSSLEFAADQILRSDIRSGDFVVWGLTSEYRAPYWTRASQQCNTINIHNFDYKKTNRADDIVDETRLYKAVIVYNQVANFCNKVGAHLIAVPILCTECLQLILHRHPNYYQLPYQPAPIDFGSDNLHPGPKQHQLYADHINNIIKGLQ
jgi:hypothetical protein